VAQKRQEIVLISERRFDSLNIVFELAKTKVIKTFQHGAYSPDHRG
jgi:hypothetical protein